MYLEGIILECIYQINKNRTIFGIYHLITGKKSIQTVHDTKIFKLESYYGIYQGLTRGHFNKINKQLEENGLIESIESEDYYIITEKGKEYLAEFQALPFTYYLNGLAYSRKDKIFLQRLYLLVQTYSNIQMSNYSFIPVVDEREVTHWIKGFYKFYKQQKNSMPKYIYQELFQLMKRLPDKEADFFVDRLSGYKHYGLSIAQLADKYNMSSDDAVIYLTAITHRLITLIEKNKLDFPILSHISIEQEENRFITQTANKTYQLIKKGYSLEKIATMRHLKLNTIYDHIVESALYEPDFPIDPFLTKHEMEEIVQAIKTTDSLKLKAIKEKCSSTVTYFQIRLMLARWRAISEGGGSHD